MSSDDKIVLAIPSLERSETLMKCTLRVLTEITSFPIFVFVSNPHEKIKYESIIPRNLYTEMIVTYTTGLAQKRNFITDFFDEGQMIIQVDDDIEELCFMLEKTEKKQMSGDVFDNFCKQMFELCIKYKTKLWGIYPLSNSYFMNDFIWVGKFYVVGAFFGLINDKDVKITNCLQEDKQRSLLFAQKYEKIIRCNFVGIRTKYWKNQGGMQSLNQLPHEIRNDENILDSILKLQEEFPNQTALKKPVDVEKIAKNNKKNCLTDVRIKKIIFQKIIRSKK